MAVTRQNQSKVNVQVDEDVQKIVKNPASERPAGKETIIKSAAHFCAIAKYENSKFPGRSMEFAMFNTCMPRIFSTFQRPIKLRECDFDPSFYRRSFFPRHESNCLLTRADDTDFIASVDRIEEKPAPGGKMAGPLMISGAVWP